MTRRLTVLYDGGCEFCLRCGDWLMAQPLRLEMELLDVASPETTRRYGFLPHAERELTVIDDHSRMWTGADAFVLCLWATLRYHDLATFLATPLIRPLTETFFKWVGDLRSLISACLVPRDGADCSTGGCGVGV